jgi:hypothetical protein
VRVRGGGQRWWPQWAAVSARGTQCRATGDGVSPYGFLGGDWDEWKARGEGGVEVHWAAVNGGWGGAGGTAAAWCTREGSERPEIGCTHSP